MGGGNNENEVKGRSDGGITTCCFGKAPALPVDSLLLVVKSIVGGWKTSDIVEGTLLNCS